MPLIVTSLVESNGFSAQPMRVATELGTSNGSLLLVIGMYGPPTGGGRDRLLLLLLPYVAVQLLLLPYVAVQLLLLLYVAIPPEAPPIGKSGGSIGSIGGRGLKPG